MARFIPASLHSEAYTPATLPGKSARLLPTAGVAALGNTSGQHIRPQCPEPAILKAASPTKSGVEYFFRSAEPSVPDVSCQKGRNNMVRFHTLQSPDLFQVLTFRKGDSVFLAKGSCQGTVGTFLNFRDDDPKWADIFGAELTGSLTPRRMARTHSKLEPS